MKQLELFETPTPRKPRKPRKLHPMLAAFEQAISDWNAGKPADRHVRIPSKAGIRDAIATLTEIGATPEELRAAVMWRIETAQDRAERRKGVVLRNFPFGWLADTVAKFRQTAAGCEWAQLQAAHAATHDVAAAAAALEAELTLERLTWAGVGEASKIENAPESLPEGSGATKGV
mgnify:CR=1 FL=1